jgi:hypothetical protein
MSNAINIIKADATIFASIEAANAYYECSDVFACIEEGCEGAAYGINGGVIIFTDVALDLVAEQMTKEEEDIEEGVNYGSEYSGRDEEVQERLGEVARKMF